MSQLLKSRRLKPPVLLGPHGRFFRTRDIAVLFDRVHVGDIPPHQHVQTQITLTLEPSSGVARLKVAGAWREIPLTGREGICIPPSVLHEGQWKRESAVLTIYLEPRLLRRFPSQNVTAFFGRESLPEAAHDPAIWEWAGAINFLCSEDTPDASLILDNAVLIVKRLFLHHATPRPAGNGRKMSPEQRQRMDAYIQANIAKSFRVPHLARAMSLSPPHLTALCRNTHGKPPREYVWERRLLKAHGMALADGYLVREIARACGFYDASHLNREFKRFFKKSVSALLRRA